MYIAASDLTPNDLISTFESAAYTIKESQNLENTTWFTVVELAIDISYVKELNLLKIRREVYADIPQRRLLTQCNLIRREWSLISCFIDSNINKGDEKAVIISYDYCIDTENPISTKSIVRLARVFSSIAANALEELMSSSHGESDNDDDDDDENKDYSRSIENLLFDIENLNDNEIPQKISEVTKIMASDDHSEDELSRLMELFLKLTMRTIFPKNIISITDQNFQPPSIANNHLMASNGSSFSGIFTDSDSIQYQFTIIEKDNGVWAGSYYELDSSNCPIQELSDSSEITLTASTSSRTSTNNTSVVNLSSYPRIQLGYVGHGAFEATAIYESKGKFIVKSGSYCSAKITNSCPEKIRDLRDRLIREGLLIRSGDRYRFTEDVTFSSPSQASSVVYGGSSNGLTSWADTSGRTLKEF